MNKNVNIELAKNKGLIVNDSNNNYKVLENLYKYLFEYYLLSKVDLRKYDEDIFNSNLYFGISNPSNKQKGNGLNEYIKFNYIYLLNNFFVEKLSVEDINKLQNALNEGNLRPTPELLEIIDRTYKQVIRNNYTNNGYLDNVFKVYYGEYKPDNFVDNDALVIKIFYGKNSKELSDDEYLKNMSEKKKFLNDLSIKLMTELKEQLDLNINILIEKIPN